MSDQPVKTNQSQNDSKMTPLKQDKEDQYDSNSKFSKTKNSTNKKDTSGTQRRAKRVSAYEASDEEQTEFEKLENQLGVKLKQQQDAKPKKAKKKRVKKAEAAVVEQLVDTPMGMEILAKAAEENKDNKKGKSKCFNIFCCGYCCSKDQTANEKKNEANLSRPEKKQEIEVPKKKKAKAESGKTDNDQDLSIEEEQQQDQDGQEAQDEQESEGEEEESEEVSVDQEPLEKQEDDLEQLDKNKQESDHDQEDEKINDDENNSINKTLSNDASILQSQKSGSEPVERKNLTMSDDEQEIIDDQDMEDESPERVKKQSNNDFMRIENSSPDSQIIIPEVNRSVTPDDVINNEEGNKEEVDDNLSDKTNQDNDGEEYKQAQAKRMYVIQEVDEDTLSENSKILSNRNTLGQINDQSAYNEGKLETLKEEKVAAEEDEIFVVKDNIGDVSNIQVNASQDIDPVNMSYNEFVNAEPRLSQEQKVESPKKEVNEIQERPREKSKTLYEKEENSITEENINNELQSKSFVEFTRLLDMDEEVKEKKPPQSQSNQQLKKSQTQQEKKQMRPAPQQQAKYGSQRTQPAAKSKQASQQLSSQQQEFQIDNLSQRSQQQQQQPVVQQIVYQKVSVDKSKLSENFYSSFDQFLVANSVMEEAKSQKDQNLFELELKKVIDEEQKEIDNNQKSEKLKLTKEEAIKKLQERKSLMEQQKQKIVAEARESALKKEKDRKAKQMCAVVIQKNWKGFMQQKEYKTLQSNLSKIKKLRKLFETYQQSFKRQFLNELLEPIKKGKMTLDIERYDLMENYKNICALQIQKYWRGRQFRKTILPGLKRVAISEDKIRAFVKGWKMRKVMQTKEVFAMNQYVKDLIKVQEYFVYIEKSDNVMLMNQLKKDRRKAVDLCVSTIKEFQETGSWVKSYIGNKIIENESQNDSTDDGNITPHKKDVFNENGEKLKELITTERFFSEEELKKNPYIFETDEFVRQKYLEGKYKEYQGININNEEFVNQKAHNESSNIKSKQGKKPANDDQSSKYDNDSVHLKSKSKKSSSKKLKQAPPQLYERDLARPINEKDNVKILSNNLTFEQILENAMQTDGGADKNDKMKHSQSQASQSFLKKKERYDPKKALQSKSGSISQKNIDKKRFFKKNKEESGSESEPTSQDNAFESKGTFKNIVRKSVIQFEDVPKQPNKTVLPPSLLQKLYREQEKIQKFFRSETGRVIGSTSSQFQPLSQDEALPMKQKDDKQVIYELEELEAIYKNYYGGKESTNYFKNSSILREKASNIPLLKEQALFFTYYDDSVYESVLDDLKKENQKQTKENKAWHFGSQ